MKFGLSRAILLASTSLAGRRPARELSRHVESSNLSATGRKLGLQPARELVADLLVHLGVRLTGNFNNFRMHNLPTAITYLVNV